MALFPRREISWFDLDIRLRIVVCVALFITALVFVVLLFKGELSPRIVAVGARGLAQHFAEQTHAFAVQRVWANECA